MDKAINQVRQILMNELGLTRETVREETNKIVKDTVETYLSSERFNKVLERIVAQQVDQVLRYNKWDKNAVTRIIMEAAEKHVASKFEITISTKV